MSSYRPKPRDEIARNMSAIRSKDNRTEVALRKILHRRGLRYRTYYTGLPGKPDIVFPRQRLAVFIDGDYWHGRLLREKGLDAVVAKIKSPNREYWVRKFQRNVARDDFVTSELRAKGWTVLRFWESDTKRDIEGVAQVITAAVRGTLASNTNGPATE
ncbi:very short patch repair endonuclease [Longimicrobium terrae]|uniref:DNA mismatch endonuclease (Patch repair protein) n=1 Tax=Longimicrobium terrae TaxID=1639882 RepID=A0A841GXL5_9BACT|nr:very short patch repair endonuclease [Longimicrobium terrae]MBB4636087.1 DNA mismatch endonuclease (patch repair protein) [Longimicrobium terrae]MBB6070482.1 DNA mismatch endonuclease (patch repair protein) [Longimicrobium terrae]NNC29473.1 very short patch repair endonuclease [Longimicrobium terrae]